MTVFGLPSSARISLARACTAGVGGHPLHLGHVDRDRERAGLHLPAVDLDHLPLVAQAEQVPGEADEVLRRQPLLEADQVGAEQAAQHLGAAAASA